MQIEKMAALYLKISDIAAILNFPENELRLEIKRYNSPASIAYHRGKSKSKLELHEQEMLLAKVGSPVALENCKQNLMEMEEDE